MNTKRVVLFMLLVPVLAELLSGDASLPIFLNPLFLLLQILSYGIPITLIREATIRWNLGLKGLFILGIGYGFFNEGVLAKTLAHTTNLLGTFTPVQFIGGLNPYWVVYITVWHALHSVIYPILIMQFFYPSWEPWLNKPWTWIFAILTSAGILIGLYSGGNGSEALISCIFIIALIALAKFQKKKILTDSPTVGMKAFWIGIGSILATLSCLVVAKIAPFIIFLAYVAVLIWFFYFLLKKNNLLSPQALLLFGLGDYIAFGFFIMIGGPWMIIANIVIITFLIILTIKVHRRAKLEPDSDRLQLAVL